MASPFLLFKSSLCLSFLQFTLLYTSRLQRVIQRPLMAPEVKTIVTTMLRWFWPFSFSFPDECLGGVLQELQHNTKGTTTD